MKRSRPSMDKILEAQIQVLTTTRRPKTVKCYRYCAHNFLAYLHTTFPRLHKVLQLRRDPHLLAWFRFLCQQYPSPGNRTRHLHLLSVRRLLRDLVNQGQHSITPDLIRREDFPPPDHYLPKTAFSRGRSTATTTAPSRRHPGGERSSAHACHGNPHQRMH